MPLVFDFDHAHRRPPMEHEGPPRGQGGQPGRDDLGARACRCRPGSPSAPPPAGTTWRAAGPTGLTDEVAKARARLEKKMGKRIGDPSDPLLVSVRSGAKFSMPGMMDTVLNLGLNDHSVEGLAKQTDDERFAFDSYRRFVAMYGRIVLGIPGEEFDTLLDAAKELAGTTSDAGVPSSSCGTWSTPTSRSSSATPARRSPRTPTSSCAGPSRRCSPRGTGRGPSPTGCASASPTTSAPRSTCRPWCSATATTRRAPGWASPGTRRPGAPASTATSWSTPRARTWWPASGTPSRSRP